MENPRSSAAAKNEVEQLQHELQQLKASLHKMDTRQEDRVVGMVRHIRQLVCEAEDSIDEYCFRQATAPPPNQKNIFRGCLRPKANDHLHSFRKGRLTATIRKARMAIDRMQSDHGFGLILDKLPTAEKEEDPSIKVENIVGLQDEADKLIRSLMEETEELDVISIVGMPGLGKTTLASMIYRHSRIENIFPTRIWVHVSQEFNRRNVLLNILKQLTE